MELDVAIKEEMIQRDLIFQFNFEQSNAFWKAAMGGNFKEMQNLYDKHLDIGLSLQQQFRDSYVQTAFDWAIVQDNKEMVSWLCKRLAWSFRYTITDFKERFPDFKQTYNGRKTYHYWHAAEKNKFQDMIEMLETANGMISANLIRAQKTALDFSVIHKNEAMNRKRCH